MDIIIYKEPQKYMRHMFEKEIVAPVVARVKLEEPKPTAQEIADAKSRPVAKMKLIGNTFVKKPEDVCSFFITAPFFNMYQNQLSVDWSAKTIGDRALPIRDADYAMKELAKRIPYVGISPDRNCVQKFIDLMTQAIKEMNSAFMSGDDNPKATYNCYETTEIQSEPVEDGLLKQTKDIYVLMHTVDADNNVNLCIAYAIELTYYVIRAEKAWAPLHIVPEVGIVAEAGGETRVGSKQEAGIETGVGSKQEAGSTPAQKASTDWLPIVDRLAHFQTMTSDRSEEEKLGEQLLSGGNAALEAMKAYLVSCARGIQSAYWWNDADYLVKLIAKFPGADYETIYKQLMEQQTNIWEYHTKVIDVAQQELLKLKKNSPEYDGSVITEEDAQAELKGLYNAGCSEDERIKRALKMKSSSENWSDDNKAFYYYIIGDALRVRDGSDARQYPFFAAQIFYQPNNTSLGWHELKKLDAYKEIEPSPENAKLLHEQLPLPQDWEDLTVKN